MKPRLAIRSAWLLLLILAGLGAGDPEVVKVRVPSSKVSSWFPAGTDLETLTPDRFEALLRAVRDRPVASKAPRILRARHSARLDRGVLIGRTELMIESTTEPGSQEILLDPWSPAIDPATAGSKLCRSSADGKLTMVVEPSTPRTIDLEWRLSARPGSEGRLFSLALPELDVASLVLDLPVGWMPEAKAGPRLGPEPGASPDRSTWRFEAARGLLDLRLSRPDEGTRKADGPSLWVEGTTRIDLNQSGSNWRADWTVDESAGASKLLTVDLDKGLDLVDVIGPRVGSFREEVVGNVSRVTIKLEGDRSRPANLTIRAIAQVPAEGPWVVPSARPRDAYWTGGRTIVTLDGSRILQRCVDRAGRRVAARPTDPVDPRSLIFESTGEVGPVAELSFRRPTADATVDIRGRLFLGDEAPRIEVALTWMVDRGRVLSHAVDLPPGWVVDRVLSSVKQPVPWHADSLGNGGTRIYLGPSLPDENALMMTLTLCASAPQGGVTGLLDLPRVRPALGVRVVDEIWTATPAPGLTLRPMKSDGVAWIDPLDPPLDDAPAPWVAEDLKNAMAWRWLVDDAEVRIDRTRTLDHPRADVKLDASIQNQRLGLSWVLSIDSDLDAVRTIPIHLDEPIEGPIRWRSRGNEVRMIEARPLDDSRRAKLGFPATGSAWDLELSSPLRGRIVLEATVDQPWSGRGRIPILTLPRTFRSLGLVTLIVDDTTRIQAEVAGLTPIDPSSGSIDSIADDKPANGAGARTRRAALYAYRSEGGRLAIETTASPFDNTLGLIRDSYLVSQVFPGLGLKHRLTLKIAGASGRRIGLKMPAHSTIDRVRRDGQSVTPFREGPSFEVAIPDASNSRVDTTLTIDYRTDSPVGPGSIEPAKWLPECSLPCLGFAWELITPDPWVIDGGSNGLVSTEPGPVRSVISRLLGFTTPFGTRAEPSKTAEAMLAELDRLASEPSISETTLGEWLLKLDSGRWPLVVDRLAIRSMGWGPSSRINLAPLEATTLGPVKGVLQSIGLTATPLGGVVLISSRLETPERPADREAWATALREVPSGGSDSTDRFQSAGRWSGEATPRALAAGESPERSTGLVGWHSCRLVSSGWPGPRAFARLVSPRIEQAWGWLIASIVLAGGILLRNQRPRVRGCVLVGLGIATSVVLAWTWPEPPTWATGMVRGILGVTAFWVGSAFRKSPNPVTVSASEGSTTSRRSGFLAGVGGLVVLVGASIGQLQPATADNPKPEPPILALLVFDGTPDATSRPDRVILSLKDANRLRRLGEIDPTDPSSVVNLTAESHRVRREGPRTASVESRFEIDIQEKKGGAPARWTIPVGLARDLSSTVDGRPCPVRISADGQLAGIEFDGTGRRQVSFHRSLPISDFGAESERLLVPINRAAFATVVVENEPGKQVEIPSALGLLETGPGGIAGGLGPVDTLDVRWASDDRRRSPAINGPVEATLLWDARPVGDLIRVRLTHSDPDGSSTLRLALEPGLIVRGHSIPNVVSIRREGTVDRPEWVARIDPPWPKETPVEVDLWRAVAPGSIDRRWPSIGIGTVGKVNQLLGLRRPADWTGRLEPGQMAGVEAVAEPTFVKAWGPLDDPSMILAGAVRFSQVPAVGATIRPIALRRSILSNTRIDLVPGRMEVTIEATLKDLQGRSFNLDLGLPNELKLIKVEALGLVDWQRPTRDRLRLQFDGAAVTDRPIRIEGSLPVRLDPDRTETATYQAAIPWPRWADVEAVPGTLSVVGSTRFQVDPEAGVMELPPTSLATGETGFRTSYRVDRPTTSSTVRWSAQASRLGVSVQSDLRIESDSVDWTAVMVCDIAGEPIDHLNWNLPTEWARNATLEIEGHSHRIEAEIKGETSLWTIRPDSRLWGRVKLILRSKRAIGPARRLAFPDLAPLATPGRGSVERYLLAIANVSGREVVLEGLKGLQPIDLARTTLDDSLGMSGLVDHAFQVKGGRWSLGLSIGPASPQNAIAGESGASKIRLATICAVVGEAGEVRGLARYELQDRTGPFLRLQVPDSVEIPWSMVDGLVQPVIREGPGRRLVPLGDREARRVSVLWHRRRSPTDDRSLDRLALPEPVSSHPPTFVTIAAPPSVLVAPEGRAFEKIGLNIGNSESAQWMAGGIIDRLENLDPLAPEARERLLEDLIELELRARTNERQRVTQQSASDLPQIRTALASIQEAAENFGLADLIVEAQARVGLVRGLADPTASHTTSLVDLVRLRRVGVRSDYRTAKDGSADPLAFTIRRNESEPVPNGSEQWRILGIGLVVSLVLGRWVARPWTSTRRTLKVLTWVGLALIFVWEPLGMAGLLALAGLGRKVG